jgi:hypothetical protein
MRTRSSAGADRRLRGGEHAPAEDQAVRQREVELPRDEDRVELVPRGVRALRDDPDRLDHGHAPLGELAQQPVLALGNALRQLLQRVVRPVQLDEADDVATDAARDVDMELRRPLLEWEAPRKLEERALVRPRDEPEVAGSASGGNGGDP